MNYLKFLIKKHLSFSLDVIHIVLMCDMKGFNPLYFDKIEFCIPLNSIKNKDNIVKDALSILDLLERGLI